MYRVESPRNATLLRLVVLLLLALLSVWHLGCRAWEASLERHTRGELQDTLSNLSGSLSSALRDRYHMLEGLATFVRSHPSLQQMDTGFAPFAQGLSSNQTGVIAITAAPEGVIRYTYPFPPNAGRLGWNVVRNPTPGGRTDVVRTLRTGRITVSDPYYLRWVGQGIVLRQALFMEGRFWGLVAIVVDVPGLLRSAGLAGYRGPYSLRLRDRSGRVMWSTAGALDELRSRSEVPTGDGEWLLEGGQLGALSDNLGEAVLARVGGLAVVALLTILAYGAMSHNQRLRASVESRTRELNTRTEALRRSEDSYRALARGFPNGMVLLYSQDLVCLLAEGARLEGTGLTKERLEGHPLREGLGESVADEIELFCREGLRGLPSVHEMRVDSRTLEVRVQPVSAADDGSPRVMLMSQDITERRASEDRLRAMNRALRTRTELGQLVVRASSEEEVLRGLCTALVSTGGYRMAWIALAAEDGTPMVRAVACDDGTGAAYLDLLAPAWREACQSGGPFGRAMETHEAVTVEMPPPGPRRSSGSETPRDLTAFLVLPVGLGGETAGVLCVYSGHPDPFSPEEKALLGSLAIDLAHGVSSLRFSQERLMAQAALMESERRFREVLSGTHLLALIVDSMGRVQYCNDALLTLLDRSCGEVLGKGWFESFIAEGVRESARARFLTALEKGESPRRREDALVAAGGARRLVSWSNTVLMGADGQAVGVASLGDDITERRQVEEEREATLALLRLATTSKDLHDLAHRATHFLRRTSGCELVAVRFRVGDDFPFLEQVTPRDQTGSAPAQSMAGPRGVPEATRPLASCLCHQVLLGSADSEKLSLTEHGSLWANSRQYLRDRGPQMMEEWCPRCQATVTPYESVALIPLRSAEGPLGLLQFSDRRQGLFSEGRLRLLESLADSLAMALAQREMQQALLEGEARLKVALDRARSLSVHLNSVREEQNARIAREVHDELGQHLTGLKMGLSWLLQRLPAEQESERASLLGLVDLVNGTIESVRRIARELRPAALDDLGLVPALRSHLRDFQQRTGLTCQLRATPEEVSLAPDVATALFRIAQEALTNAARHSGGTVVVVSLSVGRRGLSMSIRDNGVGISPDRMEGSHSFGLLSMKERVLAVGGTLSVSGREGEGTRVLVTIPAAGESGAAAQTRGTRTHG